MTDDSILEGFLTATQKQDETVLAWGLRLEELMHEAISKGNVKREDSDNLLKRRFSREFKSEKLRNATSSKFESKMNFDQLKQAVREEEQESKTGVQHQPIQQREKKNEIHQSQNYCCRNRNNRMTNNSSREQENKIHPSLHKTTAIGKLKGVSVKGQTRTNANTAPINLISLVDLSGAIMYQAFISTALKRQH